MPTRKRIRSSRSKKKVGDAVSTATPIVLKSLEDVKTTRASIAVSVVKLREKIKVISVKEGSVVANALDKTGEVVGDVNVEDLDIRVNGAPASLLQVLRQNDTIYVATKVKGGHA